MYKSVSVFLTGCLLLIVCDAALAKHLKKRFIKRLFKHSPIVNNHFTGFALYNLDSQKMVYELNPDKYFTPASNTKLFTFYTCLKMLGDSIPGLQYINRNDSLIFWGTGDPSFLHSDLKGTKALNFLKASKQKLYFSAGRYTGNFYGNGWAYDDYNEYYQAEINELPVEDNVAIIYGDKNGRLQISPPYLNKYLTCDSTFKPAAFTVKRNILNNTFIYPLLAVPKNFKEEIPWKTSPALTIALLQDTLKKQIGVVNIPVPPDAQIINNAPAYAVYKRMLQPSDNFIAEQLLLVCASTRFKTLNKDSVINYSLKNYLTDLPDKPQWADGSGLSRGNLFTPRTMITLLKKILEQVRDENLLHSLLPAGGMEGTLKSVYKTDHGEAFVWAKTGSLSNNHNQSGYLITRKGTRLAFSFMNNNFIQQTRQIRDEMVRIMTYIHENF